MSIGVTLRLPFIPPRWRGHVPEAFLHEARDYANGLIDAATLGRRLRARYGLGDG